MTHYFYQEGKEPIEIALERCRWEIHYDDGFVLKQFDDYGCYHPFSDIDQKRPINKVVMVNDDRVLTVIYWKAGYKLIHFHTKNVMRVQVGVDIEMQPLESFRIYVIGYQYGHEKVMLAIMPDDAVIVIDDIDRLQVS
jgi:hypothetical protein